ncbi:MAG: nucleoside kinase [Simkaniaceae bacterium]|nr:nucleoside kinase [Simkaniaceae bacterium]
MIPAPQKATITHILTKVFLETKKGKALVIEHSYQDGYFCHVAGWEEITDDEVCRLENEMRLWLAGEETISTGVKKRDDVIKYMMILPSVSKTANARKWPSDNIPVVLLGKTYMDYMLEPVETDKDKLHNFCLEKFNEGFLLRFFPDEKSRRESEPLSDDSKLFQIIEEIEQWGDILDIATIQQVNTMVQTGEMNYLLWVAEGLHEKKISQIADKIVADFPEKKVVSIAGPSSSGKTTFAKRLGIQLRINGFKTLTLSMDDYFIDRSKIQKNADGIQDFESIDVLDLGLLVRHVHTLLSGGVIQRRSYDFKTGRGSDTGEKIRLGQWDLIILEGIHGLNPALTQAMGHTKLHHIYVSAITQLNIDSNHRISTSDNRLLRRLVRDHLFRGYTPEDTLERWPSVREGEERNIFLFQEEADFMFNSSLVYELSVLAKYARPLLQSVSDKSPMKGEAERLDLLMALFVPMDEDLVPGISILREFVGESDFHY